MTQSTPFSTFGRCLATMDGRRAQLPRTAVEAQKITVNTGVPAPVIILTAAGDYGDPAVSKSGSSTGTPVAVLHTQDTAIDSVSPSLSLYERTLQPGRVYTARPGKDTRTATRVLHETLPDGAAGLEWAGRSFETPQQVRPTPSALITSVGPALISVPPNSDLVSDVSCAFLWAGRGRHTSGRMIGRRG